VTESAPPTPVVAIVGRPNVGKSTLFNRLVRARLAIVHDEPGVTRDRKYADANAFGRSYRLVDTGGFDPAASDPMKAHIASQVRMAIAEADAVLFVTDATAPLGDADRSAVALLRSSGKPVIYAANKADSAAADADAFELYRLGVAKVFPISALHGRGVGELEMELLGHLPDSPSSSQEDTPAAGTRDAHQGTRIALVGRPNAGKSSLLNLVLGENRVLVDPRPGTTRDAIDVRVEREGRAYVLVDTAGLRRKSRVARTDSEIETQSAASAIRSIERAHVALLLCDANEGVAEQDAKILGLAEERGRAMVIALNKADLLSAKSLARAEQSAREKLRFVPYVPIVSTSAVTGRGVDELFEAIDRARESSLRRVTTGELNRFFEQVLDLRPPPTSGGRAPRIYYVTQASVAPPTFVAMTNAPDAIHFSYQRFVVNQLRKRFGFEGSPVRLHFRPRRRRR
jgi:GTP-binding protein